MLVTERPSGDRCGAVSWATDVVGPLVGKNAKAPFENLDQARFRVAARLTFKPRGNYASSFAGLLPSSPLASCGSQTPAPSDGDPATGRMLIAHTNRGRAQTSQLQKSLEGPFPATSAISPNFYRIFRATG